MHHTIGRIDIEGAQHQLGVEVLMILIAKEHDLQAVVALELGRIWTSWVSCFRDLGLRDWTVGG